MSYDKFHDGGDALGASEYFTGGDCGCSGGVEGGSPWTDGGAWNTVKQLTGWNDVKNGMSRSDNTVHLLTYISMGVLKACIIVLIVLLFLGYESDHWSMILIYVVGGLSLVGYIGTEVYYNMYLKPQGDAYSNLIQTPSEAISMP